MTDRDRAIALINEALKSADDDTLKKMLCAVLGHPPVVAPSMYYVFCGRCEARIGITGVFDSSETAILGHMDCDECQAVVAGMSEDQKLMTRMT